MISQKFLNKIPKLFLLMISQLLASQIVGNLYNVLIDQIILTINYITQSLD